ncbi:MAG: hypothetical protein FJY67_07530 [Calditrichaeota bacterium]|nr:hypothetical protein [Calditrichota bacterium]
MATTFSLRCAIPRATAALFIAAFIVAPTGSTIARPAYSYYTYLTDSEPPVLQDNNIRLIYFWTGDTLWARFIPTPL